MTLVQLVMYAVVLSAIYNSLGCFDPSVTAVTAPLVKEPRGKSQGGGAEMGGRDGWTRGAIVLFAFTLKLFLN